MSASKKSNKKNQVDLVMPETTLQLLVFIIKNFIRNLPKIWKSLLIKIVLIFLGVMIFNLYMVAHVNQGFNPNVPPGSPSYDLINIGSNQLAFSTLIFLFFYVISTIYAQIKQRGFLTFMRDIITIPVWIISCFDKSNFGFSAFLIWLAVISSTGIFFKNTYLLIVAIISIIISFSLKDESMTTFVSRIFWSDFQSLFMKSKEKQTLNVGTVGIALLAILIGLILLLIVPDQRKTLFGILVPLISIALLIGVKYKFFTKKAAIFLMTFGLINVLYYIHTGHIYADDGGGDEYSGKLIDYPKSPGAKQVINSGVAPGILGGAGVIISSISTTIGELLKGLGIEAPEALVDILDAEGADTLPVEIIILDPSLGGPGNNPYTAFKGKNPC